MKKSKSILLSFLILVLLCPIQAFAAGKIDINKETNLTIIYQDEDKPLIDVQFDLYQIATVDEYGQYTTTTDFNIFNVDIKGENDTAWKTLATTLVGYILRDNIEPTSSGKTNSEGILKFENQSQGLYLVVGNKHQQDNFIYSIEPFIVQLPSVENNEWIYDVVTKPKNEFKEEDQRIDLNVIKKWNDSGYVNSRPKEIVIQLLCDNEVYDTITLNKENNWRYAWKDLDADCTWYVVEKEMEDYAVGVNREGNTFIVNNTFIPTIPPGPTPPELPDTGQLWWPVPILTITGLSLIVIGILMNKKKGMNHEG